MSAKFFDLHDESNPDNGAELFEGPEARALLARNTSRQAFFAELISDHQTRLLIGLGSKIGCAVQRFNGRPILSRGETRVRKNA